MLSDLECSSGSHPHRCDHTQDVDAEPAGTESAEARRGSGGRSSSLQPRFRCQVQIYISIGTSTTDIIYYIYQRLHYVQAIAFIHPLPTSK